MNSIIIIGNLSKDVEKTTTTSGLSVCKFTVAVNRMYTNADGERPCDFIPVVVWRGLADNCATYLSKGSKVCVRGELQMRTYEAQDGTKRTVAEVVAGDVEFLNRKADGAEKTEKPKDEKLKEDKPKKKLSDLKAEVTDDDFPF